MRSVRGWGVHFVWVRLGLVGSDWPLVGSGPNCGRWVVVFCFVSQILFLASVPLSAIVRRVGWVGSWGVRRPKGWSVGCLVPLVL